MKYVWKEARTSEAQAKKRINQLNSNVLHETRRIIRTTNTRTNCDCAVVSPTSSEVKVKQILVHCSWYRSATLTVSLYLQPLKQQRIGVRFLPHLWPYFGSRACLNCTEEKSWGFMQIRNQLMCSHATCNWTLNQSWGLKNYTVDDDKGGASTTTGLKLRLNRWKKFISMRIMEIHMWWANVCKTEE